MVNHLWDAVKWLAKLSKNVVTASATTAIITAHYLHVHKTSRTPGNITTTLTNLPIAVLHFKLTPSLHLNYPNAKHEVKNKNNNSRIKKQTNITSSKICGQKNNCDILTHESKREEAIIKIHNKSRLIQNYKQSCIKNTKTIQNNYNPGLVTSYDI